MLTRKRNRKFIIIIITIILLLFVFNNKSNAFTSSYNNSIPYMSLKVRLLSTGALYPPSDTSNSLYYNSIIVPVFAGYSYQFLWTQQNSGLCFGFVSSLDDLPYATSTYYNPQENITMISPYNTYITTGDYTITLQNDGYIIVGGFYGTVSNSFYDYDLEVYSDYDGTSNLTSVHNDLTRIETLLKEYLYGDAGYFPVSFNQVNGLVARLGHFEQNSDYITIYFNVRENETYKVNFSLIASSPASYMLRYGYTDNIPSLNLNYIDYNTWTEPYNNYLNLVGNGTGNYIYISYSKSSLSNFSIESTYNEGQENGLYGGLTNINNQVLSQGQEISDDITSTNYDTNTVSINSDVINNIDSSANQGLFTTIFNNFNNAATGGVDSITIPMPYNSGNIVLTSDVVSKHIGSLSVLISAFWYFVFGFYAFKFVNNFINSIKSGDILNGFKSNSEVITTDML